MTEKTPTLEELGIKLAVALPVERNIRDWAFQSIIRIAQQGWPIYTREYGRTDIQRNQFGVSFLRSDFTHLVMLDSDHTHPADVIERLVRWVVKDRKKYQIVSGLNFRRAEPYDPIWILYLPNGELVTPVDWKPAIYEAHAIGHGCMIIAREVLETVPSPWWQYTYEEWNPDEPWKLPTEDIFFSRRCREYGFKMWIDTTLTSPHLADKFVTESDHKEWIAKHPETVRTIDLDNLSDAQPSAPLKPKLILAE